LISNGSPVREGCRGLIFVLVPHSVPSEQMPVVLRGSERELTAIPRKPGSIMASLQVLVLAGDGRIPP
jgi:hypothetical protein